MSAQLKAKKYHLNIEVYHQWKLGRLNNSILSSLNSRLIVKIIGVEVLDQNGTIVDKTNCSQKEGN